MTSTLQVEQTIQEWGNGLGIRITSPVAKAAHFSQGAPVLIQVIEDGILVRVAGKPKLSLAQKLKVYDSKIHGGEVMADTPVGKEII